MKTIARTLIALAISAVILEVGLRVAFGFGNPVLFSVDSACGYMATPNQKTKRFGAHVAINHAGMRSPEFLGRKPGETHRILFVGDSVTFGPTFVDQAELFSIIVPGDLERSGAGKWESLNASAPGWATGNELGFLRSRGTFDSDIVVLVINTGDLDQPFTTCDGRANCQVHPPPFAIWEAIERYALPRLDAAVNHADPGSTGETAGAISFVRVIGNIAAFRKIVEQNNARFILVYLPARGEAWGTAHWKTAKSALDEWVRADDVPFVDLSNALTAVPMDKAYFDGIHLRPMGHRIAATQLENFIASFRQG
jgi:hypothetical protein